MYVRNCCICFLTTLDASNQHGFPFKHVEQQGAFCVPFYSGLRRFCRALLERFEPEIFAY
jgi:hypothetical protein